MIKSCLSLLAGAYAQHFTSFASNYGLLPTAIIGAAIALFVGGRGAAAWFTAGTIPWDDLAFATTWKVLQSWAAS
jgi:predicted membrane chloride channel (bestrophin family)